MAAQVPYPRWTTELPRLVDRQLKGAREVVAQFDRPYLIDAGAFEAAFGPFETTPHEVAIADTVAWLQQDQPVPV